MKQLSIFILFLAIFSLSKAQSSLDFETFHGIGSRFLNRSFLVSFWQGDFIDSTMKNNTLKTLKENNQLGMYQFSRASYFLSDSSRCSYFFSTSNTNLISLQFPSTAFELIFNGNASFEGQKINIKNNSFSNLGFFSVHGGIVLSSPAHKNRRWLFSVGPVFVYQWSKFSIKDFDYDASKDDSINIQYNLNYERIKRPPILIQNPGVSFSTEFEQKNQNSKWKISVQNIGMVHLSKNSILTKKQGSIQYGGINVNDFALLQNNIEHFTDSIENDLSLQGDTGSKWVFLPSFLRAEYSKSINKYTFGTQIFYFPVKGFIPELSFPLVYQVSSHWKAGGGLVCGGFSGFDLYSSAIAQYDKFHLLVECKGLGSALLEKKKWLFGLNIGIRCNF